MQTHLKFIIILISFALQCCGQAEAPRNVDPKVLALSRKIIPLSNHLNNPDSCRRALSYLDSATQIDNNCFSCYHNKLMFLLPLGEFNLALETIEECIRIAPSAHYLYGTAGILYEQVGNTDSAKKYHKMFLDMIDSKLEAMDVKDQAYDMLLVDKAICLIVMGKEVDGRDLLSAVAERQDDPGIKGWVSSFNKNKEELLHIMKSGEYRR